MHIKGLPPPHTQRPGAYSRVDTVGCIKYIRTGLARSGAPSISARGGGGAAVRPRGQFQKVQKQHLPLFLQRGNGSTNDGGRRTDPMMKPP